MKDKIKPLYGSTEFPSSAKQIKEGSVINSLEKARLKRQMSFNNASDIDKLTNRCLSCNRVVVGLKAGDMHDHIEHCNECGRMRETLRNLTAWADLNHRLIEDRTKTIKQLEKEIVFVKKKLEELK